MNREEFMMELAALLQDVPVEERKEAMQYYNNYFDDAGKENEQDVISELGSPAKVAEMIKEDLGISREKAKASAGFDVRSEKNVQQNMNKSDRTLKIVLIVLVVIFGFPVIVGLAGGIIGLVFGIIGAFLSFVLSGVMMAVLGVILFFIGLTTLIPELAVGLALVGTGLILTVLGVIVTVGSIKLCMLAIPWIGKGISVVYHKLSDLVRKAVA